MRRAIRRTTGRCVDNNKTPAQVLHVLFDHCVWCGQQPAGPAAAGAGVRSATRRSTGGYVVSVGFSGELCVARAQVSQPCGSCCCASWVLPPLGCCNLMWPLLLRNFTPLRSLCVQAIMRCSGATSTRLTALLSQPLIDLQVC
jgi:hypothetical protein